MRDIRGALGLLTVIPSGAGALDARPVAYFPWVGWLFGAVAAGIASAASVIVDGELGALLVGVVVVASWAFMSRMLHWDGLADVSDAWWGGHEPQRRLEIMRDTNVGSFAVAGVGVFLLAQTVCVAVVFASGHWWALGAAPVLGRLAASMGAWTVPAARTEGLGASIASRPVVAEVFVAAMGAGLLLLVPSVERIAVWAVGVLLAVLVPRVMARRVGGITGDVLGASIVVVETAVLLSAGLTGV